MTWKIQKLLILQAEALMRKDPNRAVRLDGLASRKKAPAAPAAPAADKSPADKLKPTKGTPNSGTIPTNYWVWSSIG